jgi:hypothetical protein
LKIALLCHHSNKRLKKLGEVGASKIEGCAEVAATKGKVSGYPTKKAAGDALFRRAGEGL